MSKSKIDALKDYYSSGPTGLTSDYIEPPKKKKKKAKVKAAPVQGLKIVDIDSEARVREPERRDESDEGSSWVSCEETSLPPTGIAAEPVVRISGSL
jgi:hypothetical protein